MILKGWWVVSKYPHELHAWGVANIHYLKGGEPFTTRAAALKHSKFLKSLHPGYDGIHRNRVVKTDAWLQSQLISKVLTHG